MVRLSHDWFSVRGYSAILLPSDTGTSTDQEGYRTTSARMEHVEGDRPTDECEISRIDNDGDVFVPSGSLQPGRSAIVPGVLSISNGRAVTFSNCITVHTPTDWPPGIYRKARKGPWMLHALDRRRFEHRIKETEIKLGDIFSDTHRNIVKQRLLFYARREEVKRRLVF